MDVSQYLRESRILLSEAVKPRLAQSVGEVQGGLFCIFSKDACVPKVITEPVAKSPFASITILDLGTSASTSPDYILDGGTSAGIAEPALLIDGN